MGLGEFEIGIRKAAERRELKKAKETLELKLGEESPELTMNDGHIYQGTIIEIDDKNIYLEDVTIRYSDDSIRSITFAQLHKNNITARTGYKHKE